MWKLFFLGRSHIGCQKKSTFQRWFAKNCKLPLRVKLKACSETMLTGESLFHISTPPRGFEPRSLVMGSKRVVHWTIETWWGWSEIAGSTQGSPPAADSVGCEAGRETCSQRETGTGKLCGIKWNYHEGLVTVQDEARLRWGHNDRWRQLPM